MRVQRLAVKTYPSNLAVRKPYTNQAALELLESKLQNSMPQDEINRYLGLIKQTCEKFNIPLKSLPLDSRHKGSLSVFQRKTIFDVIYNSIGLSSLN